MTIPEEESQKLPATKNLEELTSQFTQVMMRLVTRLVEHKLELLEQWMLILGDSPGSRMEFEKMVSEIQKALTK